MKVKTRPNFGILNCSSIGSLNIRNTKSKNLLYHKKISDTPPITVEEPSTISQQTSSAKNEESEKKNEIESPIPDSNEKIMVSVETDSPQVMNIHTQKDEIELHVHDSII